MKRDIFASRIPGMALLTCFALLALLGCSSCSKPKTASLSGSVVLANDSGDPLLDPVDFSGVTIALYAPAVLDTTLARLNTKYPQIGVLINQETEFDHRGLEPLKLASSAADGSFLLEGIDAGTYNLAFLSPEWGARYVCGLQLAEGENRNLSALELFPITKLSSYQAEDTVFKSGHCYLVEDTAQFVGTVTMQPKARIYMNPGSSFKCYGDFVTTETSESGDFWRMLPARDAFVASNDSLGPNDYFGALELRGENTALQGGIVRYFANTTAIFNNYCEVEAMIFQYGNTGLSILQGNATISNIITADCANMGIQIMSDQDGPLEVTSSIFMNLSNGMGFTMFGEFDINNNYFYNMVHGLRPLSCSGVIAHNEFEGINRDIFQYGGHAVVSYNKFYHTRDWTIRPYTSMVVNNNDFYRTDHYFVVIRANDSPPYYSYVYSDLDARNNYWAPANADDYIFDGTDNPDYPGEECDYYVLYQPRKANPVPGAGIQ